MFPFDSLEVKINNIGKMKNGLDRQSSLEDYTFYRFTCGSDFWIIFSFLIKVEVFFLSFEAIEVSLSDSVVFFLFGGEGEGELVFLGLRHVEVEGCTSVQSASKNKRNKNKSLLMSNGVPVPAVKN